MKTCDCTYVHMDLPGVLYRQMVVGSGGPCPKPVWMISTMTQCSIDCTCIDVIISFYVSTVYPACDTQDRK